MAACHMTLIDRQRIATNTMAFWFDTNGAAFAFRPGQHADFVSAQALRETEIDNPRTYSIASPPEDKSRVMIAMRTLKPAAKSAVKAAALGAPFLVSRARGSFTLHSDFIRPAVFLAGGIGIAPVRSILQWATRERLPHRMYLFYANRQADDAAFIKEFETMTTQNPNFTFIPTLTRHSDQAWPYEKGRINKQMLKRYLIWLNGPVYYIAGPPRMVAAMTDLLNSLGVSDDDLKKENFDQQSLYQNSTEGSPGTASNDSYSAT
jgi:ferredoxin-NADP reductase